MASAVRWTTPATPLISPSLGVPVVLAVGVRLGCIDHGLLTAEAIRARGPSIGGWIAICTDPHMCYLDGNIATLEMRLARDYRSPLVGASRFLNPPATFVAPEHLTSTRCCRPCAP